MIKLLVMDVDGTLTDGKIYYGNSGEEFKAFNVKDGQGIRLLKQNGIKTAILTGRSSFIVERRAKELEIDFVFQGVTDKKLQLEQLARQEKIGLEEVAYIGDDINDKTVMGIVGLVFAPQDAAQPIKKIADVVLDKKGGYGAVRECAELLISSYIGM